MDYLLPLVILINCLMIQGVLEWTVVGKVTEYGQNVTLFCNVPNCCPKDAGWDRWTPHQRTLFIDVKTGRPNKKYDGKVLKDGYTLIIQNFTKKDLNVSYSCLYGVTLGERKFLLEEDVFTSITQPGNSKLSPGEIGAILTGMSMVIVLVSVFVYFRIIRGKKQGTGEGKNKNRESEDVHDEREELLTKQTDQKESIQMNIKEKVENPDVTEKLLTTATELSPMNIKDKKDHCESVTEKCMTEKNDPKESIPMNIKDQIKKQIEDWEKKDKMFVTTRASDYVLECLQENSCVTLTASSGVGKSFISRHTALVLQKEGYKLIPVTKPDDIRNYYQPDKQTVFIIDDICGNFTANQQQIDNWKQLLPVINNIIADKCCKIIVSCRLQVYKDDKFNMLLPFKSCECNLMSDDLCLTSEEKTNIAKTYIGTSMTDIDDLSSKCDFFPLLCSLYHEKEDVDVKEYFKNPFDVFKRELDRLSEHGDEGNYKICSLALCVLFNNQLNETWFQGKATDEQRQIINDTCEACEFNSIPKAKLKKALDTLDGTFVCKQNGIYRTLHDKLFDFLAHYFGQKMIECLIDHGDSELVHERFIWQTSPDEKKSNIDFIIKIPDDYLESYLQRLIKDWSVGKVTEVFCNNNMEVSSFRQKLLQYLIQLDKPQQIILASTKDTVVPKESFASGNTPLIGICYYGYTDMIQWMLLNDVDVDQCRDDSANGLQMAILGGHTEIVKLLLERNPNVDLCDKCGFSPLCIASFNGHTDIVKLLLEKDPDVDLCDKSGQSTLKHAIQNGNTDIVKLLLEKNPNVDLCDKDGFTPLISASINNYTSVVQLLMKHKANINAQTYDGCNALIFSALNGNLEITQLLLENNADCNICAYATRYVIKALTNHPWKTLDTVKQGSYDHLVNEALPQVADYVSKKSVDYVFDVEAGCSPLHFACFNGWIDVVRCLLDHNADINITKEDGTTPLFFACEVGHTDIVHLLLEKGADTQKIRCDDKSPLNIATDNGHTDIVMMVTEKMNKEEKHFV